MKARYFSFVAVLCIGIISGGRPARASEEAGVKTALHRIEENAGDAGKNAAIYQWTRVNHEVDRVASAERYVEKALKSHSDRQDLLAALQRAVSDLRKGRLNHDVDRIEAASKHVIEAVKALEKAN